MTLEYPMLTYEGDVTGAEEAQPGQLCGWDETYRPYEVLETELWTDNMDNCSCGRYGLHTHLYLQYAKVETVREQHIGYRDKMVQWGALT